MEKNKVLVKRIKKQSEINDQIKRRIWKRYPNPEDGLSTICQIKSHELSKEDWCDDGVAIYYINPDEFAVKVSFDKVWSKGRPDEINSAAEFVMRLTMPKEWDCDLDKLLAKADNGEVTIANFVTEDIHARLKCYFQDGVDGKSLEYITQHRFEAFVDNADKAHKLLPLWLKLIKTRDVYVTPLTEQERKEQDDRSKKVYDDINSTIVLVKQQIVVEITGSEERVKKEIKAAQEEIVDLIKNHVVTELRKLRGYGRNISLEDSNPEESQTTPYAPATANSSIVDKDGREISSAKLKSESREVQAENSERNNRGNIRSSVLDSDKTQEFLAAYKGGRYYRAAKLINNIDNGNMTVQLCLGWMYHFGKGVVEDKRKAVEWYRKAAMQGDAVSQCNLGYIYDSNKNFNEAIKWYRKAAEQGLAVAQYNLGVAYEHGLAVAEDKNEAIKWYRKAAAQGDAKAKKKLKELRKSRWSEWAVIIFLGLLAVICFGILGYYDKGKKLVDRTSPKELDNTSKALEALKSLVESIHPETSIEKSSRTSPRGADVKTNAVLDSASKMIYSYSGPVVKYAVQRDDYLEKISKKKGVSLKLLKEMNNLPDEKTVGSKLLVPVMVDAKCKVRITAFEQSESDGITIKNVVTTELVSELPQGVSAYKYWRGDGFWDVLLCADEQFVLKAPVPIKVGCVRSLNGGSAPIISIWDVDVKFKNGEATLELDVKDGEVDLKANRVDDKSSGSPTLNNSIEEEFTTYIVQRGDYLAKIPKKFNVTISALRKANPQIRNDTVLLLGQKIKIPGKHDVGEQKVPEGTFAATEPKQPTANSPYTGATEEYVVKSGDTLGGIAYPRGINIRQLKEMNGLSDNKIYVGLKLKVPAGMVAPKAGQAKEADPEKTLVAKTLASVAVDEANGGVDSGHKGKVYIIDAVNNELIDIGHKK